MALDMSKPVILTGLRANSEFHLGNYLGAILPMLELQRQHAGEYQVNMFVPDLHSFTTPIDHSKLYQQTLDNLRVFVAAGLDIQNPDTYIYRQSYVPAHSELTWILDCFIGYGELARMTQFKDKTRQFGEAAKDTLASPGTVIQDPAAFDRIDPESLGGDRVTAGLFNYPALMAADILLYGAQWIPVGEDQQQHIELTRDVAIRMNNKFNQELFTVPEEWSKQLEFANRHVGVRIRSLRNPEKKMSKSVDDPAGTIMLSDSPEEAAKKVMSATTDSLGAIHLDWEKQPGVSNLLQVQSLLLSQPLEETARHWEGKSSYGDLKSAVAEDVKEFLHDFQGRLASVNEAELLQKLATDEEAMRVMANETLLRIQKAVGLRPINS